MGRPHPHLPYQADQSQAQVHLRPQHQYWGSWLLYFDVHSRHFVLSMGKSQKKSGRRRRKAGTRGRGVAGTSSPPLPVSCIAPCCYPSLTQNQVHYLAVTVLCVSPHAHAALGLNLCNNLLRCMGRNRRRLCKTHIKRDGHLPRYVMLWIT